MNYLIFAEIILGYYYIKESFFNDAVGSHPYLLMLIFVIYLISKLIIYIQISNTVSKASIILSACILMIDYYYGNGILIIFFPITLCQFNNLIFGNRKILYLLLAVPLTFISKEIMDMYVIVAGLSFALELSTRNSGEKIAKLQDDIYDYKLKQQKLLKQVKLKEQDRELAIYQVKLEERNEISQKLHDEIGHNLAGNIMKLEAIKKVLEVDKDKGIEMLNSVTENLRYGMQRIREILKKVKPERSSVNISNIKDIVNRVNQESGCKISLKYNSDINILNQNMWNVIVANIRETMTNMIKYSESTDCNIEFTKLNKIYRVVIKDNGKGCKNIKKGLGLQGIEDRMAMIDGKAIFDGSNGFSTTMIFDIKDV